VKYNREVEGHRMLTRTVFAMLLSVACLFPIYSRNIVSSADVRAHFASPQRGSSTAPFLVWNDWMTEQEVRETMQGLAGQGVRQIIIHPRPGLMTPYLSDDWFRMWKVALEEAGRP
jgi:hypothetical protein